MNARTVKVTVTYLGPDGWNGARYMARLSNPRRQLSASYDYAASRDGQRSHLAGMLAAQWCGEVAPAGEGVYVDSRSTVHYFTVS